jgi:hypothetical protein
MPPDPLRPHLHLAKVKWRSMRSFLFYVITIVSFAHQRDRPLGSVGAVGKESAKDRLRTLWHSFRANGTGKAVVT